MNRDGVVKAELKTTQKSSLSQKWEVPPADVIVNPRQTRASKPEVLYHFSLAAKSVIVQQPTTPKSSGEASGVTLSRSTSPVEHLIAPPRASLARQLSVTDQQGPSISFPRLSDEDQQQQIVQQAQQLLQQQQQPQQPQQQPQQQQPVADDDDDQLN